MGAGAAGMSCAEQLSLHPDRFEVTVIETQGYCGGQAFSIPLPKEKYGADWMNQVSRSSARPAPVELAFNATSATVLTPS